MHSDTVIKKAQGLFESEGVSPPEIGRRLGVSRTTIYSWLARFGWVAREEEAELIILQEFKRLVAKSSFSEAVLRKMKNLRNILDEYENRRSILARDIESLVNRHRGSAADKTAVLNEMIVMLNKHTGSTMRIVRDLSGKQPKNDFREI